MRPGSAAVAFPDFSLFEGGHVLVALPIQGLKATTSERAGHFRKSFQ